MLKSKTIAIVQSNYIPWKGYFDLAQRVDELVLYDDAQYTRRDWRNRNLIKTASGVQWLTIPVSVRGKYLQRINETRVLDPKWTGRHWKTIVHAYRRAPHFQDYETRLAYLYAEAANITNLSHVNRHFLAGVLTLLGIQTPLRWSSDFELPAGRTERLVAICIQAGATQYLSGPAARTYIDQAQFEQAGIGLEFMNYTGYPVYEQLYPPFIHTVSIIDVIFNTGMDARTFIQSSASDR